MTYVAGEVIPFQFLSAYETDLSNVSMNDLLMCALANLDDANEEGLYGVRHGSKPMNTFGRPRKDATQAERKAVLAVNPMTSLFPGLYPYAEGGIEADREVPVSFNDHVRWSLQYYDRRFRTHHSFPFVAFGIEQKRQALKQARIHIGRRDFSRDQVALSRITISDLHRAAEEEGKGLPISNPAVRSLRKHVTAMAGKLMGSDFARIANRSKLWSTTVMMNPPTLWLTINLADIHDPIVQVFAGENIDMDHFDRTLGPDRHRRAQTAAKDPYATAKFYEFLINTILETLLGVDASGQSVRSKKGIFGVVSAYFGVTEVQGRGMLHLHMVIWLKDAPTTEEMEERLRSPAFREKVKRFLQRNIRAHLDGFGEDEIKSIPEIEKHRILEPLTQAIRNTRAYDLHWRRWWFATPNYTRVRRKRAYAMTQSLGVGSASARHRSLCPMRILSKKAEYGE